MFTMEQLIVIMRYMPKEEETINQILTHMMMKEAHRKGCVNPSCKLGK